MIKMKDALKIVLKMIGIVFGAAIIGTVLLWAVYLLPVEPMAKNLAASEATLRAQDDSVFLINEEYWKAYDLGTNIIMFYEVIQPSSGSVLQDALLAPTADYISRWWDNWTDVLMEYANNRQYEEKDYLTYARYWHGYLVFLKPLFMVMELEGIYIINAIILIALTIENIYLMRKRLGNYWIAYAIGVCVMHPFNIVQSFQLSTVFFAMQITLLLLLIRDKWKKDQIFYIFLIDGILVAFLDFLTYPFVAFGIPVLTCFLLYREEKIKDDLINIIINGIYFAIGYAGMWGMKWIVATLFTNENVIIDAIESVLHRTGMTETSNDAGFMSIGVKDALVRNLFSFFNQQNLVILAVVVIIAMVLVIKNREYIQITKQNGVICAIMAISPFAWIVLLTNHCSLHPHLEWRTFSVLIFAIAVFVVSLFEKSDRRNK